MSQARFKLLKYLVWKLSGVAGHSRGNTPAMGSHHHRREFGCAGLRVHAPVCGITAFTSQCTCAYEIASVFPRVPVRTVMGGIDALSTCPDESSGTLADAVVKGRGRDHLADRAGRIPNCVLCGLFMSHLRRSGIRPAAAPRSAVPPLRLWVDPDHVRGCPLNCHFRRLSGFNGQSYRHRPIDAVVR